MHHTYLNYLLSKAKKSAGDEVPIHALLVHEGEIIVESGNHREEKNSPMAHAEIEVITQACNRRKQWRLLDTTLYVLVEPCLMCTGVIYAARIPQVVFGVTSPKGGALLHAEKNRKVLGLNHSVEIAHGYFEDEIKALLADFFSQKRG